MIRPVGTTSQRGKQLLKNGLFVAGSLLVVAVFLFTQNAVSRLTREVSAISELLARVAAQATIPSTINPQLQRVLGEMQAGISFPLVITDTTGTPRAWRQIPVSGESVPSESICRLRSSRAAQRSRNMAKRSASRGSKKAMSLLNWRAGFDFAPEICGTGK